MIYFRKQTTINAFHFLNLLKNLLYYLQLGALEGQNAIKHKLNMEFSVQELIDCSFEYGNFGCVGGLMDYVFEYIKNHGIALEQNYPYKADDLDCQRENTTRAAIKVTGFKDIPVNNEIALRDAIGKDLF